MADTQEARWYVVHTYSGYENAVAAAIMKAAENRRMQDLIQEVNKTGIDFQKPLCLGYTGLSDTLLQRYIADSTQLWEGRIAALPICPVGPTIGTHLGPNAVIVAYFDASAGAL